MPLKKLYHLNCWNMTEIKTDRKSVKWNELSDISGTIILEIELKLLHLKLEAIRRWFSRWTGFFLFNIHKPILFHLKPIGLFKTA